MPITHLPTLHQISSWMDESCHLSLELSLYLQTIQGYTDQVHKIFGYSKFSEATHHLISTYSVNGLPKIYKENVNNNFVFQTFFKSLSHHVCVVNCCLSTAKPTLVIPYLLFCNLLKPAYGRLEETLYVTFSNTTQ